MSIRIADRLQGVSESATLKLNALVQELKARGEDVVNLTAGEPDFSPPPAAATAVERAMRDGRSKYTPVPGILELRERVARKTNRQQPALAAKPWTAANVVVSNGGKQAIFDTMLALVNPGDEIVVVAPYWLSYPEIARVCGGETVVVEGKRENGYRATPAQLAAAVGPKTRIVIFNSPSNPAGIVYSRAEFQALGKVLVEAAASRAPNLVVISDEIYDRILFTDEPFVSFLDACPELRARTVTVNGMSKSAAMTGWRIGWSVADAAITQAISTLQGQSTSGINALAQYASVAALDLPEEDFAEQVARYRKRRDLALEILGKAEKIRVVRPQGAFYLWVEVGMDAMTFAERALKEAKVAVVPGGSFGSDRAVRISFATDEASLAKGCERLANWVTNTDVPKAGST